MMESAHKQIKPCCVSNCDNITAPRHKFPVHGSEAYNIWVERLRNPVIQSLEPKLSCLVVCAQHFIGFCRSRNRLAKGSLPTLHIPEYSGAPTVENSFIGLFTRKNENSEGDKAEINSMQTFKELDFENSDISMERSAVNEINVTQNADTRTVCGKPESVNRQFARDSIVFGRETTTQNTGSGNKSVKYVQHPDLFNINEDHMYIKREAPLEGDPFQYTAEQFFASFEDDTLPPLLATPTPIELPVLPVPLPALPVPLPIQPPPKPVEEVMAHNPYGRCRLCAEFEEELLPIPKEPDLLDRISKMFEINVTKDDPLPQGICFLCYDTVNNIWRYTRRVKNAQDKLLRTFKKNPDTDVRTNVHAQEFVANRTQTDKGKENEVSYLQGFDFLTIKEDGSVILKDPVMGWENYPWKCDRCKVSLFKNVGDLRTHWVAEHRKNPKYSCADCRNIFTDYPQFVRHVKFHRPKLHFSCDICFTWFVSDRTLNQHRMQHKKKKLMVVPLTRSAEDTSNKNVVLLNGKCGNSSVS